MLNLNSEGGQNQLQMNAYIVQLFSIFLFV